MDLLYNRRVRRYSISCIELYAVIEHSSAIISVYLLAGEIFEQLCRAFCRALLRRTRTAVSFNDTQSPGVEGTEIPTSIKFLPNALASTISAIRENPAVINRGIAF